MIVWRWSDLDRPRGRWALFARSAECLTTAFLWCYAVVLIWQGSTLTVSPAFAWLVRLTGDNDTPWAIAAFVLALVAPLAVLMDDGRLRLLSLLSQGVFFLFLGLSAFVNSRLGLGWATFLASGLWLLWRACELAWPRLLATIAGVRRQIERYERRG